MLFVFAAAGVINGNGQMFERFLPQFRMRLGSIQKFFQQDVPLGKDRIALDGYARVRPLLAFQIRLAPQGQ